MITFMIHSIHSIYRRELHVFHPELMSVRVVEVANWAIDVVDDKRPVPGLEVEHLREAVDDVVDHLKIAPVSTRLMARKHQKL
jgi:hypothetical protein